MIGFDDQHGFSLQNMVEFAATAALTAGLSKEMNLSGILNPQNEGFAAHAELFTAQLSVGATVQLFQMSIGVRNKFNVNELVEQASAATIAASINAECFNNSTGVNVTKSGVDELAKVGVAEAFGYQPNAAEDAGK